MGENELSESVDQARGQLTALRARLEKEGVAPSSPEIVGVLHELQGMFDMLQTRYGLLREILDRSNDVIFAKDKDGRYALINSQGAAMFGKPVDEVLGEDDRALFKPEDAERIMTLDREVMTTGEPQTSEATTALQGVPTTLLTTTTTWYDGEQQVRGVIGVTQDVTEHRRSELSAATHTDRMRSMAAEIVIGEERLRRALAAELHNGLGQDIALAKMKLSTLRTSVGAELHDPLSGIEQLVEQADKSLRSITFQISPPSLHDLGLVAALQWLGEDLGQKHGIKVFIEDDDSPEVADERIRVILYRAVRELLINAATHASVREARVQLASEGELVRVTVEDAGAGFDIADHEQNGYGLFGIREQLKYVGGSMEIASVPGRGTKVTLTAPASESVVSPTP